MTSPARPSYFADTLPRTVRVVAALAALALAPAAAPAGLEFVHHFVARDLPVSDPTTGDYGLTALADLDHDGDLDFVLGGRSVPPPTLYWFEFQAPDTWRRHVVGTHYLSDVGLAAFDVDGDGWTDLIGSGVWFRNTGHPREQGFTRREFDAQAAGAHDVLMADLDGDRRLDVVLMGDQRTKLNALCWYGIPGDPSKPWTRHPIGPPVHGAITPAGALDVDGDGDLDICSKPWSPQPWNGNGGRMHVDWLENRRIVRTR